MFRDSAVRRTEPDERQSGVADGVGAFQLRDCGLVIPQVEEHEGLVERGHVLSLASAEVEALALDLAQSALRVAVSRLPSRGGDGVGLFGISGDRESRAQLTEGGVVASAPRERSCQLLAHDVNGHQPFVLK